MARKKSSIVARSPQADNAFSSDDEGQMEPIDFVKKNIDMTENWLDAQLDRKFQNNQINQNRAEVYKQRRKEAIEEK